MSQIAAKKVTFNEPENSSAWNNRILVVDDEPNIADGIKALLMPQGLQNVIPFRRSSRSGASPAGTVASAGSAEASAATYEVMVVNSPSQALQAIRESVASGKPFAMGFFDVLLNAEIDGIELVRQVLAIDERIQAVFVTAYNDRSVDSISKYLGESNASRWDYLNKPFTDGEILQKARNVISLWNLRQQKLELDERLNEAQKWLLENERSNTVAAVGRSFAHEFGNLMMQIMGHCELALMKKDPERMKEALDVILRASETANNILSKFKTVSSVGKKGGDSSVKSEPLKLMNLPQVLNDALELMAFQFKKLKIEVIKNDFDQVLIEANKHTLIQVLMNVLINSSHSMPNGGKVEVSVTKNEECASIKIRDTGSGIPPEILDKVTQPMFTTKGENGSGLGLSICKEIVEIEHQGVFKIGNHASGGVEVSIELPLRQNSGE